MNPIVFETLKRNGGSIVSDNTSAVFYRKEVDSNCSESEIWDLINTLGYEFLIETLDLEDDIFVQVYETLKLDRADRQRLKFHVIHHVENCPACSRVTQSDRSIDKMINSYLCEEVTSHSAIVHTMNH